MPEALEPACGSVATLVLLNRQTGAEKIRYPINADICSIGQSAEHDLRLYYPEVDEHHALIKIRQLSVDEEEEELIAGLRRSAEIIVMGRTGLKLNGVDIRPTGGEHISLPLRHADVFEIRRKPWKFLISPVAVKASQVELDSPVKQTSVLDVPHSESRNGMLQSFTGHPFQLLEPTACSSDAPTTTPSRAQGAVTPVVKASHPYAPDEQLALQSDGAVTDAMQEDEDHDKENTLGRDFVSPTKKYDGPSGSSVSRGDRGRSCSNQPFVSPMHPNGQLARRASTGRRRSSCDALRKAILVKTAARTVIANQEREQMEADEIDASLSDFAVDIDDDEGETPESSSHCLADGRSEISSNVERRQDEQVNATVACMSIMSISCGELETSGGKRSQMANEHLPAVAAASTAFQSPMSPSSHDTNVHRDTDVISGHVVYTEPSRPALPSSPHKAFSLLDSVLRVTARALPALSYPFTPRTQEAAQIPLPESPVQENVAEPSELSMALQGGLPALWTPKQALEVLPPAACTVIVAPMSPSKTPRGKTAIRPFNTPQPAPKPLWEVGGPVQRPKPTPGRRRSLNGQGLKRAAQNAGTLTPGVNRNPFQQPRNAFTPGLNQPMGGNTLHQHSFARFLEDSSGRQPRNQLQKASISQPSTTPVRTGPPVTLEPADIQQMPLPVRPSQAHSEMPTTPTLSVPRIQKMAIATTPVQRVQGFEAMLAPTCSPSKESDPPAIPTSTMFLDKKVDPPSATPDLVGGPLLYARYHAQQTPIRLGLKHMSTQTKTIFDSPLKDLPNLFRTMSVSASNIDGAPSSSAGLSQQVAPSELLALASDPSTSCDVLMAATLASDVSVSPKQKSPIASISTKVLSEEGHPGRAADPLIENVVVQTEADAPNVKPARARRQVISGDRLTCATTVSKSRQRVLMPAKHITNNRQIQPSSPAHLPIPATADSCNDGISPPAPKSNILKPMPPSRIAKPVTQARITRSKIANTQGTGLVNTGPLKIAPSALAVNPSTSLAARQILAPRTVRAAGSNAAGLTTPDLESRPQVCAGSHASAEKSTVDAVKIDTKPRVRRLLKTVPPAAAAPKALVKPTSGNQKQTVPVDAPVALRRTTRARK